MKYSTAYRIARRTVKCNGIAILYRPDHGDNWDEPLTPGIQARFQLAAARRAEVERLVKADS